MKDLQETGELEGYSVPGIETSGMKAKKILYSHAAQIFMVNILI
jgi:hypothetical protein